MLTMSPTYHRLRTSLAALAAALGAALTLASGAAQAASLVIEGAGDGHGVGMSQEGALGYAQHGASYEQILAHYYTGTALGQAPAGAQIRVLVGSKVQTMPLETYVRGVVSAEVPASWPLAALEAQAVASRTYALTAHAGGSRFDVYSDTRSQVYLRRRGPHTADRRGGRGDRGADRHLRRQPGDHLLLRELRRAHRKRRKRRGRAPRPSRG